MFSHQDDWILFNGKPILCVKSGHCLLESGCARTAMHSTRGGHARPKGHLRPIRHAAASCRIGPDGGRIVLASGRRGQTQGVVLRLDQLDGQCHIRVDGLPWDHNRIRIRFALPAREAFHPGGDGKMHAGQFVVWAESGNLAPVNGIWTDSGLWAAFRGHALTAWHTDAGRRRMDGPVVLCAESWDPTDTLVLGLEADGAAAAAALADYDTSTGGLHLAQREGRALPRVSGGVQAVRSRMGQAPSPLIWIEDWQGMRRTLLSKTSDCSWRPDPDQYSGLAGLVRELEGQGVMAAIHVLPLVNLDTDLYREAVVRGYCLTGRNGRPYEDKTRENSVAWLDLTQPACVAWIQETLRTLAENLGVRGIVAQLDEPFPAGASAQGGDAIPLRNAWAARWHAVCLQAFDAAGGMRIFPA